MDEETKVIQSAQAKRPCLKSIRTQGLPCLIDYSTLLPKRSPSMNPWIY